MRRSLFVLTFFFVGLLEARAELSCFQIFAANPKLTAFSFFQPFKIAPLAQRVDYRDNFNPESLDPTLDKLVFSRNDIQLLQEFELPMHRMRSEDRWVETDYGYALMTVNELRDWTLLARIIRDPEASKRFIENIAKRDDVYPGGITRESADWIRWSVFVNELAVQRAVNRLNPRENDLTNYQKFKIYLNHEYSKLVRKNEKLMFPLGIDMYLANYEISLKDASVVLATLARFYLLNHLYVKSPNQSYYRLLAEYLDKDTLMLMSRIPELLPSHPAFEAGHFSIDKESIRIGHDDHYKIASRLFFKASVRSAVQYEVHFVAQAKAKDLLEASADVVSGHFQFHFSEPVASENTLSEKAKTARFKKIFAKEIDRMEHLIFKKASEFEALTGYRLLQARIIEQMDSESAAREFRVTFDAEDLPAHVLAAFFIFMCF